MLRGGNLCYGIAISLRKSTCSVPNKNVILSNFSQSIVKTDSKVNSWRNLIVGRCYSDQKSKTYKNKTVMLYATAGTCLVFGMSFAAVPLYRIYCQATGQGGAATMDDSSKIENMKKLNRVITVHFNADSKSSLNWKFKPQQNDIKVSPGETALAFYTATNPTNYPVTGIATYSVVPYEAGSYFNKIQCFCFEEQRLNPQEEVDMPVFFYIDPDYNEDPRLEYCDDITLSYTFFEAKPGVNLPLPTFR